MARLNRCFNISDLRDVARRRLPRMLFDYIDGAADDETTLRRNSVGFNDYQLLPRVLRDVADLDLSTTVMGQHISLPIFFSPTGQSRMFHPDGETAVIKVANEENTIYSLSSVSSTSIETIGALGSCPKFFQIYVWKDRAILRDFVQRCRDAGFSGLILTVDASVAGNRERDLVNGLTIPPKPRGRALLESLRHPRWLWNFASSPRIEMANVTEYFGAEKSFTGIMEHINTQFDRSVTWDDAAWIVNEWNGPFAIKGIMSAEDACRAIEIGANGVMISNHGGRQLDQVPAPIDVLPEIVAAVDRKIDVILDGGVRRGTDVLKALALGATACSIGRAYLYGLAAGGHAGVKRAFQLLKDELDRDMRLLGCRRLAELDRTCVRRLR